MWFITELLTKREGEVGEREIRWVICNMHRNKIHMRKSYLYIFKCHLNKLNKNQTVYLLGIDSKFVDYPQYFMVTDTKVQTYHCVPEMMGDQTFV